MSIYRTKRNRVRIRNKGLNPESRRQSPIGGFDDNGNFQRMRWWHQDMVEGKPIDADGHDLEDDNFADGLSQCITRDGKGRLQHRLILTLKKGLSL